MLLLYPGQVSDPISLQGFLRELHEEERSARNDEIAERQKYGAPLDDTTKWKDVDGLIREMTASANNQDTQGVEARAREVLRALDGNALAPIGEYVPVPELEGISVRLRVLSDRDRRNSSAVLADHWRSVRDAFARGASQVELRKFDELLLAEHEAFVAASVVEVLAADGDVLSDIPSALAAIRRSGLLAPLYRAARAYQDLPAKKAVRFGLSPQQTSTISTAQGAQSRADECSDASVAAVSSSRERSTRPTPAHVDTPSRTLTSAASSPRGGTQRESLV